MSSGFELDPTPSVGGLSKLLTPEQIQQVIHEISRNPLALSQIHQQSDLNFDKDAQHHSLGVDPNAASPGSHLHDGKTSRLLTAYSSTAHHHTGTDSVRVNEEDVLKTYFSGWNTGAPVIANGTWTAIAYNTGYHQNDAYNFGSGAALITIQKTGKYKISAGTAWAGSATGIRGIDIWMNSGGTYGVGTRLALGAAGALAGISTTVLAENAYTGLAAGATVCMFIYQSSGGNLAPLNDLSGCWLNLEYEAA